MTCYLDPRFLQVINQRYTSDQIKTIIQVGAGDCSDTVQIAAFYPQANVYAFECNPNAITHCMNKLNQENNPRIQLLPFGLGESRISKLFYEYKYGLGASSFYYRFDGNSTMKPIGNLEIYPLKEVFNEPCSTIQLLLMDVQGYELNVLRGMGDWLSHTDFIIMECPQGTNRNHCYDGAPSYTEIYEFMSAHGFKEQVRFPENQIEDNVLYARIL